MTEESDAFKEAMQLIKATMESCNPVSPYYESHISLQKTPYKELALMIMANNQHFSRLDIAQESFRMGVFLTLQHNKLEEMLK